MFIWPSLWEFCYCVPQPASAYHGREGERRVRSQIYTLQINSSLLWLFILPFNNPVRIAIKFSRPMKKSFKLIPRSLPLFWLPHYVFPQQLYPSALNFSSFIDSLFIKRMRKITTLRALSPDAPKCCIRSAGIVEGSPSFVVGTFDRCALERCTVVSSVYGH